jgi:indole-3-glycerol phosphate synthase
MTLVQSIQQKKEANVVPIIADIKRLIPKLVAERGIVPDKRDAGMLSRLFYLGGAAGISLVTERNHFGGQSEIDIPAVLNSVPLPLLIKDFILNKSTIDFYIKLVGEGALARVTLLLHAHLLQGNLKNMLQHIHKRGMLALIETRGVDDLRYLKTLDDVPELVGINNKDIDDLERDKDKLRISREMVNEYRQVIKGSILISESAHRTSKDVRYSIEAGADAVLVGTAFMLSPQPTVTVSSFVNTLKG